MRKFVGPQFLRETFVLEKGNIWDNTQYLVPLINNTAELFAWESEMSVGEILHGNSELELLVEFLRDNVTGLTHISGNCLGLYVPAPPE